MRIGVAAIFKNEAEFVLEWLIYHLQNGVDCFFLADNVSDDGSSQLLQALDQLGIIRRIYFPRVGDEGPQPSAYTHILGTYGSEVDLLAFIDADEFLTCTNGASLKENLQPFSEDGDAGALALNWRCFGSSGHVFGGDGLVIERFTRCSEVQHPVNRHIKTIVKPALAQRMLVHHGALKRGYYRAMDGQRAQFENGRGCGPRTTSVIEGGLRVNHYVVKSRQEHILKKFRKGSGAGSASRRKGEDYFNAHDMNDCVDETLLSCVPEVKHRVAELQQMLADESPLWCFGALHVVVNGAQVQGWARSEFKGTLKVRLQINDEEFLVEVDRERPDVFESGSSDRLQCGFAYRYSRPLTEADNVSASIYGSFVEGEVHWR